MLKLLEERDKVGSSDLIGEIDAIMITVDPAHSLDHLAELSLMTPYHYLVTLESENHNIIGYTDRPKDQISVYALGLSSVREAVQRVYQATKAAQSELGIDSLLMPFDHLATFEVFLPATTWRR